MNCFFKTRRAVVLLGGLLVAVTTLAETKPKVWIISDGSDKQIINHQTNKRVGDPDDISAIAGYLLMSNLFDTRAIVVGSKSNVAMDDVANQKAWAEQLFLKAYQADLPQLNATIGGYQDHIRFIESFRRASAAKYEPGRTYNSLEACPSVQALFEELEKSDELLNVLCWGTQTETAILVNHCLATGRQDLLRKMRIISHWTSSYYHTGTLAAPEHVHNAFNDAESCAYVKRMALNGWVQFYECSSIGQYGIVTGAPKGHEFYNRFKVSRLGEVFATGKYVGPLDTVDDSDCATYWALLGNWGVSLNDIASNGTHYPEVEKQNEAAFYKWAPRIRAEMLRRAEACAASPSSRQ